MLSPYWQRCIHKTKMVEFGVRRYKAILIKFLRSTLISMALAVSRCRYQTSTFVPPRNVGATSEKLGSVFFHFSSRKAV